MKYQNFPVYQEENGMLNEVEIIEEKSQLYVMKHYCRSPYLAFPIPENGMSIYHCVTGFNSWSHKIVLSTKTPEEVFAIVFPNIKGLSFPKVGELKPVSDLKITLLGREFSVKDENTFFSFGYYDNNDPDDFQDDIELRVWDNPYLKIGGKKYSLKMSKKSTPYSGGMSFSILNIGGIGVGLAYTNTELPTRFYVQSVRAHKRVNLSIFKRVKTITETKNYSFETIHYEFQ
ncbi:MAG: hypothetical protein ABH951_02235 [Patescibacteria group bacterium]